ncbi:hypothetical protein AB6A40_000930 [Gnathostoma spinigerum]|uniref:Uncharacterized protein n=1 Tax=Gnathostoma spinigerum TaxID=75299 RepID=A0ABD6E580_9BILA
MEVNEDPSLVEDDLENTDGSDSDESDEESSDEEDEEDEEETTEEESDSEDEESEEDGASNVWGSSSEPSETEEAVEANLQLDYRKALNTIVDGDAPSGVRKMKKILKHPLLAKYRTDVNSFDWEGAQKKATDVNWRVPSLARLYSSLHATVAKFSSDPIGHYLQALTVFPNDENLWNSVGETAMKEGDWSMSLYAFGNCSSLWSAIDGTIISYYKSYLYRECLLKLSQVLPEYRDYVKGYVIKENIRNISPYWEKECERIFNEDPMYAPRESDLPLFAISEEERARIVHDLDVIGKVERKSPKPPDPVDIELADCKTISDIGILLCDTYDRIDAFGSLYLQKIHYIRNEAEVEDIDKAMNELGELTKSTTGIEELQTKNDSVVSHNYPSTSMESDIVSSALDEVLDCVTVTDDLISKVCSSLAHNTNHPSTSFSSMKKRKRKRKHLSDETLSRRSTRLRTEFNVYDSESDNEERSLADLILEWANVSEYDVIPLRSLSPQVPKCQTSRRISPSVIPPFNESLKVADCLERLLTISNDCNIFQSLEFYLHWAASECSLYPTICNSLSEVLVQCYRRWISNSGDTLSFTVDFADSDIHILLGELGCEEALRRCDLLLALGITEREAVRCHWLLAINGDPICDPEVKRSHLLCVIDELSSKENDVICTVIREHERISLAAAKSLFDASERREEMNAVEHLFRKESYDKVIEIIENRFDWASAPSDDVENVALLLVDSHLALEHMDSAIVWICRLLEYPELKNRSDVIKRLSGLDLSLASLRNLSNLVHCITPLITTTLRLNIDLWMLVYKAARRLEGNLTLDDVRPMYTDEHDMLISSLNILSSAHGLLGETENCCQRNYRFVVFELKELASVRSLKVIDELISSGLHGDRLKSYIDEVHQCTFCLFG